MGDRTQTQPTYATASSAPPDDAAIAQLRSANDAGLATLFGRYGRLAFGEAYRLLGAVGPAEVAVQEDFLEIWSRPDTFRPGPGQAHEWFLAAVRTRCRTLRPLRVGEQ